MLFRSYLFCTGLSETGAGDKASQERWGVDAKGITDAAEKEKKDVAKLFRAMSALI